MKLLFWLAYLAIIVPLYICMYNDIQALIARVWG